MNKYYFQIKKAVLKVKANNLEEAQEELKEFVSEFETVDYNNEPIAVDITPKYFIE